MNKLKKIGPYQIIKRIAEGGMAEVYLGKTESRFGVSKLVAVKTTLKNGDPERLKEMFFNEIRLSANLNHQNIVKIHDFGEFEDRGYMAMEYIHGVTLRELMGCLNDSKELLSSSFILYIIHQVSLGLAYAYQSVDPQTGRPLKLIHRDISPHNILISFEGEVKIIDFGIATATKDKDLEQSGHIKGKVSYMSPEQVQGKDVDSGSDIFALGIILWELLTNKRFFAGSTVPEVKESILSYDVKQLKNEPMENRAEELVGILPIMLHHDPMKRASDANELARLLGTVLSSLHPDFSPLALADYLKENFSALYKESLEHIRDFVSDDEKTIATPAAGAEANEDMGLLDEFDTKIVEGSFRSGAMLEKLEIPSIPAAPALLIPLHDMWGSVMKPKFTKGPVPVIPFYQFPKMRSPKSSSSSYFVTLAFSFLMIVASGLLIGKSYLTENKSLSMTVAAEPAITPEMIQNLRTSIQRQPVISATPAPSNPLTAVSTPQKALQKSRSVAAAKANTREMPPLKTRIQKRPALDLEHFKYGLAYPSGSKCITNCPIKIGSQGD